MATRTKKLKAPFPAFGGKARAAELVWPRFGDIPNYIEPFCFSAAMLLCRPHPGRIETINDVNCYVANFWRAIKADRIGVALHADGPVNEADMHARHRWLVSSPASQLFREAMRTDPFYYDARIAGWWCWGACCWIGAGWCADHGRTVDGGLKQTVPVLGQAGKGVSSSTWDQRPNISWWNGDGAGGVLVTGSPTGQIPDLGGDAGAAGRGIHASAGHKKRPRISDSHGNGGGSGTGIHYASTKKPLLNAGGNAVQAAGRGLNGVGDLGRPQLADAYSRGRGVHGNDRAGTCQERLAWILDWFQQLEDRLRSVRVCCGQWNRVCNSPSVTTRLGITGVFLDPPYPTHAADGSQSRDGNLYASDHADGRDGLDKLRDQVLAWCRKHGPDPKMRIAVCGYDTDGYAALEQEGWSVVSWKSGGGYGNRSAKGNSNAARERIWFSPNCIDVEGERMPLFGKLEG